MPRLLRFITRNGAEAPLILGPPKPRVSSPPGSFSTLITSAPKSASIIPAVGPAMICASSSTRMPASGPAPALLAPIEQRLALGEERGVTRPAVRGVEAVEGLVLLGSTDRARFGEPAREPLVLSR